MNYLIAFLKLSNQESDEAQKGIKLGPIQLLNAPLHIHEYPPPLPIDP